MFEPVVVLEAFFGVMLGWIALVCLDEGYYLIVFGKPALILGHRSKIIVILWSSLWPKEV